MALPTKPKLRLEALHERHTGLTASLGGIFFETASVCLSRHHDSPVDMKVVCNGDASTQSVEFTKPDVRVLNAWANDIDTTENGAYGVCLAAVEVEENLVAVRRAEEGVDLPVVRVGLEERLDGEVRGRRERGHDASSFPA